MGLRFLRVLKKVFFQVLSEVCKAVTLHRCELSFHATETTAADDAHQSQNGERDAVVPVKEFLILDQVRAASLAGLVVADRKAPDEPDKDANAGTAKRQ